MNKLFKPRCMRRIILFFSLAFPMVYLMGTAFFALNGSHGNVLLSQEEEVVTSSKVVDFNQTFRTSAYTTPQQLFYVSEDGFCTFGWGTSTSWVDGFFSIASNVVGDTYLVACHDFDFDTNFLVGAIAFTPAYSSSAYHRWDSDTSSDVEYFIYVASSTSLNFRLYGSHNGTGTGFNFLTGYFNLFNLTQMYGAGNEPTADVFLARYNADYYDYTLSNKIVEQTIEVPTYSEYLFNQVFGHDNIVTQLGYYALSEEQKGFFPVVSLIRFVDENILKWGTDNSVALFTYGYLYYAMNVIIVYEIAVIAIKLLLLPLKAIDVFDKGEDKHD